MPYPGVLHQQPCLTQSNYETHRIGPPKTGGSWWRGLTECGPLEKGMAFSIQNSSLYCLENSMNSMKRVWLKIQNPVTCGRNGV